MPLHKLGKLAAVHDPRTLRLKDYLTLAQLPAIPPSVDWTDKVSGDWQMFGNDSVGDCTCAAASHLQMAWTASTGAQFTPTAESTLAAYSAITGYNPAQPDYDPGASEIDVLNYWKSTGINGRQIAAYISVDMKDQQHVEAAIALFGGIYIGVELPGRAMEQFEQMKPWEDLSPDEIEGGHAIPLLAFDRLGCTAITWGRKQYCSWGWLAKYADEGFCVLSQDFMEQNQLSPSGFNLAQLQADLALVTN